MGRVIKLLFQIAVLGFLGLAAYALVADLPAPVRDVEKRLPVPGQDE